MDNFQNSKTAKNLVEAFISESQARNRYDLFSQIAQQDGYIQMKNIFTETAKNEQEHARIFWNFLIDKYKNNMPLEFNINLDAPIGQGTTLENLKYSADSENNEEINYNEFSQIANDEGFTNISIAFDKISLIEKSHKERFEKLASNIENNKVFSKDGLYFWKCGVCGFIHFGKTAPETCPACKNPQENYAIFTENY